MSIAWTDILWKIVYPPRCLLCRALLTSGEGMPLCSRCQCRFSPAGLLCPCCEQRISAEKCSCKPEPLLNGLYAVSWYQGEWRKMLHQLKYEGGRRLSRPLGGWLGQLLVREARWPLDLVVPLPLHRLRERDRGYNQSKLLARYVAREMGLPMVPLLKKARATPAQTGLSRPQRRANMAGAFSVSSRRFIPARVLLIDDIYSTGATVKEAARVLYNSGCMVYAAVIAYNPRLH